MSQQTESRKMLTLNRPAKSATPSSPVSGDRPKGITVTQNALDSVLTKNRLNLPHRLRRLFQPGYGC